MKQILAQMRDVAILLLLTALTALNMHGLAVTETGQSILTLIAVFAAIFGATMVAGYVVFFFTFQDR